MTDEHGEHHEAPRGFDPAVWARLLVESGQENVGRNTSSRIPLGMRERVLARSRQRRKAARSHTNTTGEDHG